MSSKILITGCTGFVGKQLIKILSSHNLEITLIVREGMEEQIHSISKKKISSKHSKTVNFKPFPNQFGIKWKTQTQMTKNSIGIKSTHGKIKMLKISKMQ